MTDLGKTYLGDAVYAAPIDGGLVLTTENGVTATNVIVLEQEIVLQLEVFIAACRKAGALPKARSHA